MRMQTAVFQQFKQPYAIYTKHPELPIQCYAFFVRHPMLAPNRTIINTDTKPPNTKKVILKNAEAVRKPRKCQNCDEAGNGHEAECLSFGLR